MKAQGWAALIAGGAALMLFTRKGQDVVSTIGQAIGVPPSEKVRAMAVAIARAEGFYLAGSLPARAHNPGDLKIGDQGNGTINGITVFATDDQGWAALYRQLNLIVKGTSKVYGLGMTIADMGNKWAPAADRNVPGAWSNNVAGTIGVTSGATLRSVLV